MDFYVSHMLVVELKSVDSLLPVHVAQVIAYLKATDQKIGLLINFHAESLRKGIRRIVNPDYRDEFISENL